MLVCQRVTSMNPICCCEPKSPGFFTDAQVSSSKLCLGDGFLHPFLMNTKGIHVARTAKIWLIYVDLRWLYPMKKSPFWIPCASPLYPAWYPAIFHYIFTMFLFLPWLNRWIHGFIFSARWFVFFLYVHQRLDTPIYYLLIIIIDS